MPDIVIPGTPATPGTPDTVIPGSPGYPGYSCPGPPVVTSGPPASTARPVPPDDHVTFATFEKTVQVGGKKLNPGTYQIAWTGLGPTAQVKIDQKGKQVLSIQARIVVSQQKAERDAITTRSNPDGSDSLESLQFENQTFQVFFD